MSSCLRKSKTQPARISRLSRESTILRTITRRACFLSFSASPSSTWTGLRCSATNRLSRRKKLRLNCSNRPLISNSNLYSLRVMTRVKSLHRIKTTALSSRRSRIANQGHVRPLSRSGPIRWTMNPQVTSAKDNRKRRTRSGRSTCAERPKRSIDRSSAHTKRVRRCMGLRGPSTYISRLSTMEVTKQIEKS